MPGSGPAPGADRAAARVASVNVAPARVTHMLAMAGYGGVALTICSWTWGWSPAPLSPAVAVPLLVIWLLPLAGMVRGRRYTFAWSLFVVQVFIGHSLIELWVWPQARLPAATEFMAALLWFVAAITYIRVTAAPVSIPPAGSNGSE